MLPLSNKEVGFFRLFGVLFYFLLFLFLLNQPLSASDSTLPKADYVTPGTVKSWLKAGQSLRFVDVREPKEYEKGHIEGAINIPYAEVEDHLDEMGQWEKATPLIFYCTYSSWRAPYAANLLKDNGFQHAFILEGGIAGWQGGGQTIRASQADQVPEIIPYSKDLKIELKHPQDKQYQEKISMTPEELKRFDGKEGRPAYVALNGMIYDITQSRLWRGGAHDPSHGKAFAGRDLTKVIDDSPHGPKELGKFPIVGYLVTPAFAAPEEETSGGLLYSQLTDGFWQIWKKSGEEPVQLTFSPYDKRRPLLTAGGDILYHTNNDRCFRLTRDGKEEELLSDLWPVRDIVPSPTRNLYVFSRFRTDLVDQSNLWLFDPLTGDRKMLTRGEGIQYQPAWSPDGNRIVYSAGSGPRSKEIFVIGADGTGEKQLTQNNSNEFTPSWSPDGQQIVFSSNITGDFEVWSMNADGSEAKQLTHSPGLDTRPVFSSDGSRIAFTSNRSGDLEIWVMEADGSNQKKWENHEAPTCDPFWF